MSETKFDSTVSAPPPIVKSKSATFSAEHTKQLKKTNSSSLGLTFNNIQLALQAQKVFPSQEKPIEYYKEEIEKYEKLLSELKPEIDQAEKTWAENQRLKTELEALNDQKAHYISQLEAQYKNITRLEEALALVTQEKEQSKSPARKKGSASTNQQVEDLKAILESTKNQLKVKTDALTKLQEEKRNIEIEKEAVETNFDNYKENVLSQFETLFNAKKQELERQIKAELTQENIQLQHKLTELQSVLEEKDQNLQFYQTQFEELGNEKQKLTEELKNAFQSLIEAKQQNRQSLSLSTIPPLSEEISKVNKEERSLEATVQKEPSNASNPTKEKELEQQLSEQAKQLQTLEGANTALSHQLVEQETQQKKREQELDEKVKQLEAQLKDKTEAEVQLSEKLKSQSDAVSAVQQEKVVLAERITELEKLLAQFKAPAPVEEKPLEEPKPNIDVDLNTALEDLKKHNSGLQIENEQLKKQITSITDLESQIRQLKSANEALNNELRNYTDQTATISQLRKELENVNNALKGNTADKDLLSRLKQEIAELKKNNDELKKALEVAQKYDDLVSPFTEEELNNLSKDVKPIIKELKETVYKYPRTLHNDGMPDFLEAAKKWQASLERIFNNNGKPGLNSKGNISKRDEQLIAHIDAWNLDSDAALFGGVGVVIAFDEVKKQVYIVRTFSKETVGDKSPASKVFRDATEKSRDNLHYIKGMDRDGTVRELNVDDLCQSGKTKKEIEKIVEQALRGGVGTNVTVDFDQDGQAHKETIKRTLNNSKHESQHNFVKAFELREKELANLKVPRIVPPAPSIVAVAV